MPKEVEEEDECDEQVVHAIQMGLSPQSICSASTVACPSPYHRQDAFFLLLLFGFHWAYQKDCFCVSNLSIGFWVFVLIVVCFSL